MTLELPQLLTMYRQMATIRAFDNRAVDDFMPATFLVSCTPILARKR